MHNKHSFEISPQELSIILENEESFFLLDVRNADAFHQNHLDWKKITAILNIPCHEMIEKGGKEDARESINYYIESSLSKKLPKDQRIVITCSRGNSSAVVAEVLHKLGYHVSSLSGGMCEWSQFFTVKAVIESPQLSIFQVIRLGKGCLSYLIVSDKMATVIDPARDLSPYHQLLKSVKAEPQFILDTHIHADHISGGKQLADHYNVPYLFHPYDGIHPLDMLPATISYEPSWENKLYPLGSSEIKALHIPGHTLGNQAFLLNDKYLFAGDSLFLESIARPDLGGKAETWTKLHYHSLRNLLTLPDDTLVLPGHFSKLEEANKNHLFCNSLGKLKETNEGLLMAQKSLDEFSAYILKNLPTFPKEYIEIKRVNIGLSHPNEKEATQLEEGKNICALSH